MFIHMKTISISVSEEDYEAFRAAARAQSRPIAQLIRDAMAFYRSQQLEARTDLGELPTLPGHRSTRPLPSRSEIYDEAFDRRAGEVD